MLFLISIILACGFVRFGGKALKKYPYIFYVAAFILTMLSVWFTATWRKGESGFLNTYLMGIFTRGTFATALWCIVMWTGAMPNGSALLKKLMPIRGELSIFAAILTLGHNIGFGQTYFVLLFTDAGQMTARQIAASILTLVMLAIMIPLTILSFPQVRRRIKATLWKKLQRTAYIFYALIYVHVIILCYPLARSGNKGYQFKIVVYSVVFLAYAVCRIRKWKRMRQKENSKRTKKTVALSIGIMLVLGAFFGQITFLWRNHAPVSCDILAMDTYMNLKVYGGDKGKRGLKEAVDRIFGLESLLSVTKENSDVWKINHANGAAVNVGEDTIEIIKTATAIGAQTNGALDITVYPVLKEWGFTMQQYKIPDEETIDALLQNVDYRKIEATGDSVRIPQGFQLDLGALAKGYAGDQIMEILKGNGIRSAVINLGGNVQTLGKKPNGALWKIAVKHAVATNENIGIVAVEDKAVITSGNYERYFVGKDGKRYWHIIDAKDGYPANQGLISVTIIGECGLTCDALSTALFVAGQKEAENYWRSNGGFDMILVTDDQELYITEGIEDCFTSTCDLPLEIIRN